MENLYLTFRYLDDPEQKFAHARFPTMPRVGDTVRTPPPREMDYVITSVGFECEGSHTDETYVVVTLRRVPPTP
jgi:hypothetical protein